MISVIECIQYGFQKNYFKYLIHEIDNRFKLYQMLLNNKYYIECYVEEKEQIRTKMVSKLMKSMFKKTCEDCV